MTIAQVNALEQTRAEVLDRKIDRIAAAEAYTERDRVDLSDLRRDGQSGRQADRRARLRP